MQDVCTNNATNVEQCNFHDDHHELGKVQTFQQAFKDFFFFNHYEQVSLTTLALNKCVISVTSSNASVRSYKLEKEAFRVEKHSKE